LGRFSPFLLQICRFSGVCAVFFILLQIFSVLGVKKAFATNFGPFCYKFSKKAVCYKKVGVKKAPSVIAVVGILGHT